MVYRLSVRVLPWWNFTLAVLAIMAFAWNSVADAATPSPKWQFQWRPNWVPGDPVASEFTAFPVPVLSGGVPVATPGLLIAIDPVTRKIVRPSLAQRQALAADAARAAALQAPLAPGAFLPVERLPGGGEMVHLNGRFDIYSVARRDANGHITTDCAHDLEAAKKLLAQPAPAPPARVER